MKKFLHWAERHLSLHSTCRRQDRQVLARCIIATFVWISFLHSDVRAQTLPATAHTPATASWEDALRNGSSGLRSLQRLQEAWLSLHAESGIANALKDRANALTLTGLVSTPLLETTKFQAFYQGLEVIGSSILHHRSKFGTEVEDLLARFDLDVEPSVTLDEALSLARAHLPRQEIEVRPELKILPSEEGSARLVYWISLEQNLNELYGSADLLLDAHSGDVIAKFPHSIHAAELQVYSAARTPQVVNPKTGSPAWVDWSKLDQVVRNGVVLKSASASARRAKANAKAVENYYRTVHDRDSYDDAGSDIVSVVHYGRWFGNAAWNQRLNMMLYGDGDGFATGDFTRALDVAGHEFTHAVISQAVRSGSTKGLVYMGESGALNEAYADIFGTMISGDDTWIMGEDLFLQAANRRHAIRDIANPGSMRTVFVDADGDQRQRPYPKHVSEKFATTDECDDSNDLCWVHANSTIWSHGAYQVARTIGKAKTEKLYYLALTHWITPTSSFRRAATATLKACNHLYDDRTCEAVKHALAKVGL